MSTYQKPGFYTKLPEIDAARPLEAKATPSKKGELGYHTRQKGEALDPVNETSLESFPASNPQANGATPGNPIPKNK